MFIAIKGESLLMVQRICFVCYSQTVEARNKNNQGRISSGSMICSKIVNFDRTEAGFTSKWGRISPAVHSEPVTTSYDDVRRRATSPKNLLHDRQAGISYRNLGLGDDHNICTFLPSQPLLLGYTITRTAKAA